MFDKLWDFENLYQAHKKARPGKRNKSEVIEFELNLSENISRLSEEIKNKTYRLGGYYSFMVYDPKEREIQALHYRDRVVQHCLCDEILMPLLEPKLIYDNAACRINKGTLFAINRVTGFLQNYYWRYGPEGFILKCDIRKYFNHIDHEVLKEKIHKIVCDTDVLWMLDMIIDSYEHTPGKGLPMGNQTSQWFALYYLDGLDRLIKEKLQIKYYSRYMDDCVLIFKEKYYLKICLEQMTKYITEEFKLEFNEKTQIFPIKNGVDYMGFHFYLTESGKVIRKVRRITKQRFGKRLRMYQHAYKNGHCSLEEISQTINAYQAHMSHGHTWNLRRNILRGFVLTRVERH